MAKYEVKDGRVYKTEEVFMSAVLRNLRLGNDITLEDIQNPTLEMICEGLSNKSTSTYISRTKEFHSYLSALSEDDVAKVLNANPDLINLLPENILTRVFHAVLRYSPRVLSYLETATRDILINRNGGTKEAFEKFCLDINLNSMAYITHPSKETQEHFILVFKSGVGNFSMAGAELKGREFHLIREIENRNSRYRLIGEMQTLLVSHGAKHIFSVDFKAIDEMMAHNQYLNAFLHIKDLLANSPSISQEENVKLDRAIHRLLKADGKFLLKKEIYSYPRLTRDMIESAIRQHPCVVNKIAKENITIGMAIIAMSGQRNGNLKIERLGLEDDSIKDIACQHQGWSVPIKDLTDRQKLLVLGNAGCAIKYFDEPSEEQQIAAVTQSPFAIQFIKTPSHAAIEKAMEKDKRIVSLPNVSTAWKYSI